MTGRFRMVPIVSSVAVFCLALSAFQWRHSVSAESSGGAEPSYTGSGDLKPLTNYREWIYLTSGIDMSYTGKSRDHSVFDNVFVNPAAYRSFLATGHWPDKTILVLENREARDTGSINRAGHFQGTNVMDFEVHVKDEKRFQGKWAFFSFDSPSGTGTLIPSSAPCYTCHSEHAAVDTTFVQFYPTLLPIARGKGTLSASFLKEEAGQSGR